MRIHATGQLCWWLGLTLVLAMAACGASAKKQDQTLRKSGAALRLELAQLYVNKGAKEAAIPLLQRLLRDSPRNVQARVLYASVLRDSGLYPQAEKQFRFVLQLRPKFAQAHSGLGVLYDLQRKSSLARSHHQRAIRLAPSSARYRNNLGFSLYLAGETKRAIRHLERSLAMDPSLIITYNNLGFAYGRAGHFGRAQRVFRSALSEASTLFNMALVHEEHGHTALAVTLRNKAYRLDPDLRPNEGAIDP